MIKRSLLIVGIIILTLSTLKAMAQEAEITPINGTWIDEACDGRQSGGQKTKVTFSENNFEIIYEDFEDENCLQISSAFKTTGTFVLKKIKDNDSENFSIDYTFKTFQVKAMKQEVAEEFNNDAPCGYKDWKIDTYKDFLALEKCEEIPIQKNKVLYTSVRLKDEQLFIAPILDKANATIGETPETRAEISSDDMPLKKVK